MDKIDQLKIYFVHVSQLDQAKILSVKSQTPSGLIFLSLFSVTFILTLMGSGPFYRYLPLSKLFEIASQEIGYFLLINSKIYIRTCTINTCFITGTA